MQHKPTLLLDKSSIFGLKTETIRFIQNNYTVIVPQVLLREIISALAKDEDLEKLKTIIGFLSERLEHYETIFYPEASAIARTELVTGQSVPFSGKPMINPKIIVSKDGKLSYYMEEPDELKVLKRWKNKIFTNEEKQYSQTVFDLVRNFDLDEFKNELEIPFEFPRNSIKNIKEIYNIVKDMIDNLEGLSVLHYFFNIFNMSLEEQKVVLERWKKNEKNSLKLFAPYSYYFLTVFVTFAYGVKLDVVSSSKDAKAHVDIEYFFYLPLVKAICSDDKLFKKFFDAFSRDDQVFFNNNNMREEISFIQKDEALANVNHKNKIKINPSDFESKTYSLWFREYFNPFNSENLVDRLSEQQRKDLAESILTSIDCSIEYDTKKPLNADYAKQYEGLDSNERFFEIFQKAEEIFHLNKKDNQLKKNISNEQIKEFYSFYADIWLPHLDTLSLLPARAGCHRGIYLGGYDLFNINEILYMVLLFDELILIDPMLNPRCIKSEHNPINKPEQYKQEILRCLWVYSIFEPFVKKGFIKFIPSPFWLGGKANNDASLISKKRLQSILKSNKNVNIFKNVNEERNLHEAKLSFIISPTESKIKHFKNQDPKITEEQVKYLIEYYNKLRQIHPFALEQELTKFEQMILLHNQDLEEIYFISSEIGCTPITNSKAKKVELESSYGNDKGEIQNILDCFNKFTFDVVDNIHPGIILSVKESGCMEKQLEFFKEISCEIKNRNFRKLKSSGMKNNTLKNLLKLSNDFKNIINIVEKLQNEPAMVRKYKLRLIASTRGAMIDGLDVISKKYGRLPKIRYPYNSFSFIRTD